MSNHKWVCFPCQEVVRRTGSDTNVRCPRCGLPCRNIGYKIPVPPKSKSNLWQALEASVNELERGNTAERSLAVVRRIHDIEKEIARIEDLPENPGRRVLIKSLRKQLAAAQLEI